VKDRREFSVDVAAEHLRRCRKDASEYAANVVE
jgi:hypothetical protein